MELIVECLDGDDEGSGVCWDRLATLSLMVHVVAGRWGVSEGRRDICTRGGDKRNVTGGVDCSLVVDIESAVELVVGRGGAVVVGSGAAGVDAEVVDDGAVLAGGVVVDGAVLAGGVGVRFGNSNRSEERD